MCYENSLFLIVAVIIPLNTPKLRFFVPFGPRFEVSQAHFQLSKPCAGKSYVIASQIPPSLCLLDNNESVPDSLQFQVATSKRLLSLGISWILLGMLQSLQPKVLDLWDVGWLPWLFKQRLSMNRGPTKPSQDRPCKCRGHKWRGVKPSVQSSRTIKAHTSSMMLAANVQSWHLIPCVYLNLWIWHHLTSNNLHFILPIYVLGRFRSNISYTSPSIKSLVKSHHQHHQSTIVQAHL